MGKKIKSLFIVLTVFFLFFIPFIPLSEDISKEIDFFFNLPKTSDVDFIVSVEYGEITLSSAELTDTFEMTESQDASNVVPFSSYYIPDPPPSADDYAFYCHDIYISGSTVTASRTESTGSEIVIGMYLVEFDDSKVKVQTGKFDIASPSSSTTESIDAVDLDKAFVIIHYNSSEIVNVIPFNNIMVYFSSTTELTFECSMSPSGIDGTYYVVEDIDGGCFDVQDANIQLSGGSETSDTASITSVDLSTSFLVGSAKGGESDDIQDSQFSVYYTAVDEITMLRGGAGGNAEGTFYSVELLGSETVERGSVQFTGAVNSLSDSLTASADYSDSMAITTISLSGNSHGSGSASSDNPDTKFKITLDDANDELDILREVNGGSTCTIHYEVVNWVVGGGAPDTDPPTWDTLTESADPLELGATETININVYDASAISNVYLEYDSVNHTMGLISGDNYRNSSWTPASVGVKTYQIHMIDEHGNTNQTSDLTITVQDTTNPTISNVVESDDPLELGNTETIEADVSDLSTLSYVYLEYGGQNYSMDFKSGDTYEYTTWTPTSIGVKAYKIWAEDDEGNIGSDLTGSITVSDTVAPTWDTLTESADPLELGNNETISINVYDYSTFTVYLEFDGSNHTMFLVSGDTWRYTNWQPASAGVKDYKIYMNDTSGNRNETATFNITVISDASPPTWSGLTESADPLEFDTDNETISLYVYDNSLIIFVRIQIDGVNYTMSNVSSFYTYANWLPTEMGWLVYTIWMGDEHGNISSFTGSILVQNTAFTTFSLLIMFFFMGLMILLYVKYRWFVVILLVFLFSLVVGTISITDNILPFSPYLQMFFMTFQSIIFFITSTNLNKNKKEGNINAT